MLALLLLAGGLAALPAAEAAAGDPWALLWVPDASVVRSSPPLVVDGIACDGLATRHFVLRYRASSPELRERRLPAHLAARLDNLFDFLVSRGAAAPAEPVTAVLVEGGRGHGRADPDLRTIRAGEAGDLPAVLGTLFHELVHLFNLAEPGATQDFWSGELLAQYYADRLETLGLEHRARYQRALRADPKRLDWGWISMLDEHFGELRERERQQLLELGVSVYYYLEDAFGAEKLDCFRRAHLGAEKPKGDAAFERCFGKTQRELHAGWRRYYGLD